MKRATSSNMAILQREQTQLMKLSGELKSILKDLNESINVLQVEQLHLKSQEISSDTTQIRTNSQVSLWTSASTLEECIEQQIDNKHKINSQTIILDALPKHKIEEEEEEEEEEDFK